jgi:hypothetical protein
MACHGGCRYHSGRSNPRQPESKRAPKRDPRGSDERFTTGSRYLARRYRLAHCSGCIIAPVVVSFQARGIADSAPPLGSDALEKVQRGNNGWTGSPFT